MNFCIQYSIFQHFSKSTNFCKILQKSLQIFAKFSRIFENFTKFCEIYRKMSIFLQIFCIFNEEICQICSREGDFLVDFEKCCKMRIWTRKSASIQPRTSLRKSDCVVAGWPRGLGGSLRAGTAALPRAPPPERDLAG